MLDDRGNAAARQDRLSGALIVHLDGGREWRGGQQQMLLTARELHRRGCRQQIVVRGAAVAERMRAEGFAVAGFSPRLRLAANALCHAHDGRSLSWLLWRYLGRRRPALVASRRVAFTPRRLTGWKYRRADRVLAVSEFVRRQLLAAGLQPARVETVPDGLDATALPAAAPSRARLRAALQLDPAAPVACSLSAFTPEKNLDLLLAALPCGPANLHLLLAGEGDGIEAYRHLARARGLAARVHFRRDHAEISELPPAAWVAASDVFVLPSREEGLGSSILVAMAYGLPVLASRVGGIPELVEDGVSGLLLSPGDAPAWGAALASLAASPQRAAALGARGHERLPAYAVARLAERTLAAYRRALGEPENLENGAEPACQG